MTDEQIHPRPGLGLWVRPELDDQNVVTEVFDWDVYQMGDGMHGAVVVDCGAHIGSFSVLCASLGARAVYAVEPEPDNLRMLRKNAGPWPQIKVIEAAVGATPGKAYITGESGTAHTVGVKDGYPVRQITLPELFRECELAEVDVLKADCEGGEMAMLVGCGHGTLARVRRITMEWHGAMFQRGTALPTVGQLVQHLLVTHEMHVGGLPDQWGQLHATRYGLT